MANHIPEDYIERVYAGLIGKNIGIRLGAPVEPAIWTYERIRDVYGEVSSYLKPYRNFAADDDANGPVYFVRPLLEKVEEALKALKLKALKDEELKKNQRNETQNTANNEKGLNQIQIQPSDIAKAWLNYAREGAGMFWWGGYGRSTEHTAYLNLKNGIPAPESGSARRNSKVVAEQIGGQIFIDTWGLVWPGNPQKAAQFAESAASVSHDGEGLNGARFIAGCIAAAFCEPDISIVMDIGLSLIPPNSAYAAVIQAVKQFYKTNPDNWRLCQEYLIAEWGYDKWPGLCHIIPNAGVCALALLYGRGSFSRTVEIATMCGWDTDCNAGNVGTIAGVLYGLDALPDHYRKPINDSIVLSGLPGALNVLDLPTFARRLAAVGYVLAGEDVPKTIAESLERGDGEQAIYFDFRLSGSTHGMRVSDPVRFGTCHRTLEYKGAQQGALEFRFERLIREESGTCFFKPFYRRYDFDDERYSPVFSPIARPGQHVEITFCVECWEGQRIGIEGYVRDTWSRKEIITTPTIFIEASKEQASESMEEYNLSFDIPGMHGSSADEIGLKITSFSGKGKRDSGRLFIHRFAIEGKACYEIDLSKQAIEFGSITPFSHEGGTWSIEGSRLQLMTPAKAASYTGGYRVGDQKISTTITPQAGDCHMLVVRAKGAQQAYWGGLDGKGKIALYRQNFGFEKMAEADFDWAYDMDIVIALEAIGKDISLWIDGQKMLEAHDEALKSGMVGCGTLRASRTLFGPFIVEEL